MLDELQTVPNGGLMDAAASPSANQLLAALPRAAYRRLLTNCEEVHLTDDETLFKANSALLFAYFPASSIVTLSYAVEETQGVVAKAWPVGREGVVGVSAILGNPQLDSRADVQFAGLAYRIPVSDLLAEFHRADALQRLLLRYVFALITQASQLGVCNQHHALEQRLCRFLSRTFDRIEGNEVFVTQERIGKLLGIRRESITESASRLQRAGIIKYRRGHVTLLNRKKLDGRACACGGIIRRAFAAALEQGSATTAYPRLADSQGPLVSAVPTH